MSDQMRRDDDASRNEPTPQKEDSVTRFAITMFGIPLIIIIILTMATH